MLTVRDGARPPFKVMLSRGHKVVVGRTRTCEIVLNDPLVSRKHCFFSVGEDGVLKLFDLGARHKTLLNGTAVEEGCAATVEDGCQVCLGRSSFIQVDCMGEKSSGGLGHGPDADEDSATPTTELEESAPAEVVGSGPAEDPIDAGAKGRSGNAEGKPIEDDPGEESRGNTPPQAPTSATEPSGRPDETSLVDFDGPEAQPRPDGQACEVEQVPKNEADQDHEKILGQSLSGKLILPKQSKPSPTIINAERNVGDDGASGDEEAAMPGPSEAGIEDDTVVVETMGFHEQPQGKAGNQALPVGDQGDETNYVDPAELQKILTGESGMSVSDGAGRQDETSYIDPAELQKLMKAKSGPFGKKGAARSGTSLKGGDAGHTVASVGDRGDETSYIDPVELQRLMKSKAKSTKPGKGR